MKTKLSSIPRLLPAIGYRPLAISCLLSAICLSARAQGTAFTYQGQLNSSGSPANGLYDFTFQAFDAVTNGASLGGTVNVNAVGVANGLFTAVVDLGGAPFTGPARWLQVAVSTNGAGSFSTLTPRQPLTPSPYAIYAGTAGTVTNGAIANTQLAANSVATGNIQTNAITADKIASGQVVKSLNGLADAVSLTQGANVTINTVGNSLSISAPAGGLTLPYSGSASNSGSIFTLTNSGTGPAGVFLGKLGIGTASPQSLLNVNGDLRWGGTTSNFVYSGEDGSGAFLEQKATSPAKSPIRLQSSKSGDTTNYSQFSIDPNNGFSFESLGTGNGYVGIGTSNPGFPLSVQASGIDLISWRNPSFELGRLGWNTDPNSGWLGLNSNGTRVCQIQANGDSYFMGGNVGIGTTSPGDKLDVNGTAFIENYLYVGASPAGGYLQVNGLAAVYNGLLVETQGGNGADLYCDLYVEAGHSAYKQGGGSWGSLSDERLKKNIHPLTGVLDKLLALRGVNFEFKEPEKIHELSGERTGMIAQEVEKVFPDWVSTGKDGYKRLTYRGFEALTVEALRQLRQEKDAKITVLEKQNAEMEKELAAQKKTNSRMEARFDQLEKALARVTEKTGTTFALNPKAPEK